MEEFPARKYLWLTEMLIRFFTVLVNGVGRLVKMVRNSTIKTTVLQPYYGTEFETFFVSYFIYIHVQQETK